MHTFCVGDMLFLFDRVYDYCRMMDSAAGGMNISGDLPFDTINRIKKALESAYGRAVDRKNVDDMARDLYQFMDSMREKLVKEFKISRPGGRIS